LIEQSSKMSMQLKDMKYCLHNILFSEQCSKEAENKQRSEYIDMVVAIQILCMKFASDKWYVPIEDKIGNWGFMEVVDEGFQKGIPEK